MADQEPKIATHNTAQLCRFRPSEMADTRTKRWLWWESLAKVKVYVRDYYQFTPWATKVNAAATGTTGQEALQGLAELELCLRRLGMDKFPGQPQTERTARLPPLAKPAERSGTSAMDVACQRQRCLRCGPERAGAPLQRRAPEPPLLLVGDAGDVLHTTGSTYPKLSARPGQSLHQQLQQRSRARARSHHHDG